MSKQQLVKQIEELILASDAGHSAVRREVIYVALRPAKRRVKLSRRAIQVLRAVRKTRQATSHALQVALNVNRNVIAGAVHELKQAGVLKSALVS